MILEGKTNRSTAPIIQATLNQTQQLISQRLGDFNNTVRDFRKTQASQERDTFDEFQRFRDNEFRDEREVSRQREDRRDFREDVGRDRRDFSFDVTKENFNQKFSIAQLEGQVQNQQARNNAAELRAENSAFETQARAFQTQSDEVARIQTANQETRTNNAIATANGFPTQPLIPVPELGPAPQAPTFERAPTPARINIPTPSDFSGTGSNEFLESANLSSLTFQERGFDGSSGGGLLPPIGPSVNRQPQFQSGNFNNSSLPPVDGAPAQGPVGSFQDNAAVTFTASLGNSDVQNAPFANGAHFGLAWEARTDGSGNLLVFRAGDLDGQSQEILGFGKGSTEYNQILAAKNSQGDDAALAVAQGFLEERAAPFTQGLSPQAKDVVEGMVHHRGEGGVREFLDFFGASNFQEVEQAAQNDPNFAARYKAARIQQEELNAERVYRTKKTGQSLSEFKRARQKQFGGGLDRRYDAEINQYQSSPTSNNFAPPTQAAIPAPTVAPQQPQSTPAVVAPQAAPTPQPVTPQQAQQVQAQVQQRTAPSVIVDEQAQTVTPVQSPASDELAAINNLLENSEEGDQLTFGTTEENARPVTREQLEQRKAELEAQSQPARRQAPAVTTTPVSSSPDNVKALNQELAAIKARNSQRKRDITTSSSEFLDRQIGTQIERDEVRAAAIEAQIAEAKAQQAAEKAQATKAATTAKNRKEKRATAREKKKKVDDESIKALVGQRSKFLKAEQSGESDQAEVFAVEEQALLETLPKTKAVQGQIAKEAARVEKQMALLEDKSSPETSQRKRIPKEKKANFDALKVRRDRLRNALESPQENGQSTTPPSTGASREDVFNFTKPIPE